MAHFNRRTLLRAAGMSGLSWLTPVAEILGSERSDVHRQGQAQSVILLWLAGGPSQLETFDPHAGKAIAYGTTSIKTAAPGIRLAAGMEQTAEEMNSITLVRNVVSKEGDHERALYNVKTGYRPDPSLEHPSIGAVVCHQLPIAGAEIPRHVSILPGSSAGRGGYLGSQFNAFQTGDPIKPQADLKKHVDDQRFAERLDNLTVLDRQFANGRIPRLESERTLHRATINRAIQMMSSEQLRAFDLKSLPKSEQNICGNSAFGRGCIAAARLVDAGVRCVEVTLGGWDTHANNHDFHDSRKKILDPAFAGLIRYLKERNLFEKTIVLCGGEFGRTPKMNPAGGRDHWPHGFSVAIAGGGIPGGTVIGETDPNGSRLSFDDGIPIADIHATILHRLGITYDVELDTPIGRPMKICEGTPIRQLT